MMFEKLQETYKGKKVFLTGHTGFKGAWMLKTFSLLGAEVKGYALPPQTKDDLFHLIKGDTICLSIIADLRDKKRLEDEILHFQPDFIFHLAAQPLVRLSYEIPAETFEVNVIGTAHVLDAVRLLEKKCSLVLITTDKVYQNNEWIYPYREDDRLGGYDPYSASKACAELLIDSYRNSFFNLKTYNTHQKAVAVARAGNVIGGGDWSKDRLIPDIVRSLIVNETISIRNPNAVRPWQHVLEPVVGYLILGMHVANEPIKYGQAYNFGPQSGDALSVKEMLSLAIQSWGSGAYRIEKELDQPHEAGLLKLDISKVASDLKWFPRMNAHKTVDFTLDWYKEFISNFKNIDSYTENQIKFFLDE
ncbi:CDP-glucose 4,6-dehydratase [Flavobacterium gawalongense]|uniref:CDP-glucose 4,6-dehydratase n=1 Tax=Flavobacterium gawalongense TaxID=2594432 RepID=A0ABY3CQP6_9FLAO|nr:CDP-glucose 4,6-dehydratase [Flavobacterium gawalongense]TRX04449.1 CDP-glucose 4,6-dehydratase [Flavobacterium gawalongense]TRX10338.1 CDP-glucose 4,6-dehydratase [Flavobacterium gawalongense]